MNKFFYICILLFIFISISTKSQIPVINLEEFSSGYTDPLDIAQCGDSRLFIVQQNGYIYICDSLGIKSAAPFLDVHTKISTSPGGERGLLGLAFHPDYFNNGYFFIYYTKAVSGSLIIARYSVDSLNANQADSNSEIVLMEIPHPTNSNHNGGCLRFGPDGYLYIGTGDGGGAGDVPNNAQNTKSYLGKLLRIDVNNGTPYAIPPDNPFIDDTATYYPEIWAYGLRNPWRFSFDRSTSDLWIGDVGQDQWEEIDFQPASSSGGENYGWRCYEGDEEFNFTNCSTSTDFVFPVSVYPNPPGTTGCASVTGGYVYRGTNYPNFSGKYFFADYCSGEFRYIIPDGSGGWTTIYLSDEADYEFTSFGEDQHGELFLTGLTSGKIYKMTDLSTGLSDTFNDEGISLFPNPNNGIFSISVKDTNEKLTDVTIWSVSGQLLKSFYWTSNYKQTVYFNLSDLSNGLYLVRLNKGSNFIWQKMIIAN